MPDSQVRSKQMELFGKLHLSMDHVLAKLLLEAPPLPEALKLQTETQSLATTWVQVSEAFEKRKAMLQRRKEKCKSKRKSSRRDEVSTTQEKVKGKEKEKETITRQKSESRSANASPHIEKSSSSVKGAKKVSQIKTVCPKVKVGDTGVKFEGEISVYNQNVLKKLHELPMCQDVRFGSKKHRAIVKWMELDMGKNAGMSADLMKLLTKLQLDVGPKSRSTAGKHARKRPLESLDDTLRTDKRSKLKCLISERSQNKQVSEVVDESSDAEEPEHQRGESDSDEVEFVLEDTSILPGKNKKCGGEKAVKKKKKKKVKVTKTEKAATISSSTSQLTSKDHLVAVVAKIRADEVVSGKTNAKYLSYKKDIQPDASSTSKNVKPAASSDSENLKPGASPKSAIVLDDSDEEEEEDTKEQDSSTDDDQDLFDLNEEDVYVVEAILCVKEGRSLMSAGRRQKEADLYLVKWEGYDELTWEPDENIPRRLIEIFQQRERAK